MLKAQRRLRRLFVRLDTMDTAGLETEDLLNSSGPLEQDIVGLQPVNIDRGVVFCRCNWRGGSGVCRVKGSTFLGISPVIDHGHSTLKLASCLLVSQLQFAKKEKGMGSMILSLALSRSSTPYVLRLTAYIGVASLLPLHSFS